MGRGGPDSCSPLISFRSGNGGAGPILLYFFTALVRLKCHEKKERKAVPEPSYRVCRTPPSAAACWLNLRGAQQSEHEHGLIIGHKSPLGTAMCAE